MENERSQYADVFNHDAQACGYDKEVQDESNPVRHGYIKTLSRVAAAVNSIHNANILELGSGTGNLTTLFKGFSQVVCVDISAKMHEQAKEKLGRNTKVEYVRADILEFCSAVKKVDVIASSYALHHLTANEKVVLLKSLSKAINHGGAIVIGDLMFKDETSREATLKEFTSMGNLDLVNEIKAEFYWDASQAVALLRDLGFEVGCEQTGTLSWVLVAKSQA